MYYSTLINNKRQRRLPEDSGEWTAMPREFRHLPIPVTEVPSKVRAATAIATVLVVGLHIFTYLSLDEAQLLFAIPVVAFAAPALGVLWVAQFRRMTTQRDLAHGLFWSLCGPVTLGIATGFYWVGIVLVPVNLAFGLLGAFVTGSLLKSRSV